MISIKILECLITLVGMSELICRIFDSAVREKLDR